MNADRWETAKSIFDGALDLPRDARDAYLDEACADDAELQAAVRALLAGHDDAGDFMAAPTSDAILDVVATAPPAAAPTTPVAHPRRRPFVAAAIGTLVVVAIVILIVTPRTGEPPPVDTPVAATPPPEPASARESPDDRHATAVNHLERGTHAADASRWAEAHAAYEAGLVELSALVAKNPRVARYRLSLARQHHELALLHARQGQWSDAIEQHDTALAVRARLEDPAGRTDLVWTLQRDVALVHLGRGDEAIEHVAAATADAGTPPPILLAAADVYAAVGDDARAEELRSRAEAAR